jgi:predicted sulfurtransferase
MRNNGRTLFGWLVATLVVAGLVIPSAIAGVGLMTKEELKAMLDDPDLTVLDVRTGKDWKSSEFKIKGATHVESDAYGEWVGTYPKDQKYVLYCA